MGTVQETMECGLSAAWDDGWTDERISELIGDFFAALDSLDAASSPKADSSAAVSRKPARHGNARSGLLRLFSRG